MRKLKLRDSLPKGTYRASKWQSLHLKTDGLPPESILITTELTASYFARNVGCWVCKNEVSDEGVYSLLDEPSPAKVTLPDRYSDLGWPTSMNTEIIRPD